jgi:hypothetical protein
MVMPSRLRVRVSTLVVGVDPGVEVSEPRVGVEVELGVGVPLCVAFLAGVAIGAGVLMSVDLGVAVGAFAVMVAWAASSTALWVPARSGVGALEPPQAVITRASRIRIT